MPLVESCLSLQNRVWTQPNEFNKCLSSEVDLWEHIIRRGGLEMVCQTMRQKRYLKAPWVEMPPEGERLQKVGSIVLPADDGTDKLILDFTMPIGWDGVGTNIMMTYTGSGFDEGSGDLTWRLKVGDRWIPDFSNVIFSLNDLKNPHALIGGYIRLLSLQRVRIFVAVAVGAAARLAGGRVNAAVVGWQYPKR